MLVLHLLFLFCFKEQGARDESGSNLHFGVYLLDFVQLMIRLDPLLSGLHYMSVDGSRYPLIILIL
jgi:hypothetical protein